MFEVVAVEEVVGVEGDETLRVGVGDVDAGLLDGAKVEGLGVESANGGGDDPPPVVVGERTSPRRERWAR
ncbi:MAG TPA: hypothetical protein VFA99_03110 [Acidobacteriaceae bacterium]|nr:hypothetical protein [Acidobacteriaceae bacterium]